MKYSTVPLRPDTAHRAPYTVHRTPYTVRCNSYCNPHRGATLHAALREGQFTIPWCAFNGGNDAFVDVGNKKVGVEGLMRYLGVDAERTLHVVRML
jgi:hypothetical protein